MRNTHLAALIALTLLALLAFVTGAPAVAQSTIIKSIYLVDAWNHGSSDADGLHLVLQGISPDDLDPDGYYDDGFLERSVTSDASGVHIDWTFGYAPTGAAVPAIGTRWGVTGVMSAITGPLAPVRLMMPRDAGDMRQF